MFSFQAAAAGPPGATDRAVEAVLVSLADFGMEGGKLTLGRSKLFQHMGAGIVRMEVLADGLPVFFERVVVQLDDSGDVSRRSRATLTLPAGVELRHPSRDGVGSIEWAVMEELELSSITPGWLDTPRGLRPVVRVDHVPADPAAAMSYYLDAERMVPIHEEPMTDHADAIGAVFRENPVTTPEVILVDLAPLDEPGDRLYGRHARVEKCADTEECAETTASATPDAEGNYVFEPDLSPFSWDDPFCEVNAYHNISSINAWVRDTFGWEADFGGETWILVKVGIAWYNAAYYNGNDETAPFIIFGQDEIDMGYDADVAYHEFGHAINRSLRDHPWFVRDEMGMDVAPFGIEEGLADIWAQDFSGDPVMNSYVIPSRTADNDTTCPEDLMGEGHMEARIVSAMGWDVRERIGARAWEQIVYRTLFFLDAEAGFDDLVLELARSAADLAGEDGSPVEADHELVILEEGESRGFLDWECSVRAVPLRDGEARRSYGYGRDRTNHRDRPFPLQWRATADAYTESFNLAMRWRYPDEVDPGYRLHVSRSGPVLVDWLDPADVPEGEPEFEVVADLTVEDAPLSVSFPVAGQAPLSPGEEVYFLLSADTDEKLIVVDVEAHALSSLPPGPVDTQAASFDPPEALSGSPSCSGAPPRARDSRPSTLSLISLLL